MNLLAGAIETVKTGKACPLTLCTDGGIDSSQERSY